jgi:hypothetical protein
MWEISYPEITLLSLFLSVVNHYLLDTIPDQFNEAFSQSKKVITVGVLYFYVSELHDD